MNDSMDRDLNIYSPKILLLKEMDNQLQLYDYTEIILIPLLASVII
jgi:hypothetical protein